MTDLPDTYTNRTYQQFREDAEQAGFEVTHYHGRFFYEGPAVVVADTAEEQRLIRATRCTLNCDNMGLGFIFYPR